MCPEDSDIEVRHLRAALQNLVGYFNTFRPVTQDGFEFVSLDKAEMVQARRSGEGVVEIRVKPSLVALEKCGSLVFRLTTADLSVMLLELNPIAWQDETK
jgi:hypothetical protein